MEKDSYVILGFFLQRTPLIIRELSSLDNCWASNAAKAIQVLPQEKEIFQVISMAIVHLESMIHV